MGYSERRRQYELEGLLETLQCQGYIIINKDKILALLGYVRDMRGAWKNFCAAFEEVGGDPKDLHGLDFGDKYGNNILITLRELNPVAKDWTG